MKNVIIFSSVLLQVVLIVDSGTFGNGPVLGKFQNTSSPLIVGGRPALPGEVPYQLQIRVFGYHVCGASLVEVDGVQLAITAGHCMYPDEIANYELIAGELNLEDVTGNEQTHLISPIVIHQNFSSGTLHNDIALLFMNTKFVLNDNVKCVKLPFQGHETTEGNLTVSGWGAIEYNGVSPNELQIVEIPVVNHTFCKEAFQDRKNVSEGMICGGVPTGDISPCHGDSGGPAVNEDGLLVGIVSWGHKCGHPKYPGVFTKVSHYVEWIETEVQKYKLSGVNSWK